MSNTTFSIPTSIEIAEWLREHGYTPGKSVEHYPPQNKWCVIATDNFSNRDWRVWALHGPTPKWWSLRGRRVVGLIYFGPAKNGWRAYLYGNDGPVMLFKRMVEELSSDFGRDIEIMIHDLRPRYEAHVGLRRHVRFA